MIIRLNRRWDFSTWIGKENGYERGDFFNLIFITYREFLSCGDFTACHCDAYSYARCNSSKFDRCDGTTRFWCSIITTRGTFSSKDTPRGTEHDCDDFLFLLQSISFGTVTVLNESRTHSVLFVQRQILFMWNLTSSSESTLLSFTAFSVSMRSFLSINAAIIWNRPIISSESD